jgi:hypothetical protein
MLSPRNRVFCRLCRVNYFKNIVDFVYLITFILYWNWLKIHVYLKFEKKNWINFLEHCLKCILARFTSTIWIHVVHNCVFLEKLHVFQQTKQTNFFLKYRLVTEIILFTELYSVVGNRKIQKLHHCQKLGPFFYDTKCSIKILTLNGISRRKPPGHDIIFLNCTENDNYDINTLWLA